MRDILPTPTAVRRALAAACGAWLVCGFTQAVLLFADAPPAPIATTIRQLGDDAFSARELAGQRLIAAGEGARSALVSSSNDADLEVRLRCRNLLDVLNAARIRDAHIARDAQLDAFIEDEKAGVRAADFPGWTRFRDSVGHDRAARLLFAEMQRAEPEILARLAGDGDVDELPAAIERRTREIVRSLSHPIPAFRTHVPPGRAAALLFAASGANVKLSPTAASQLYSLLHQQDVGVALGQPTLGPTFRKLLGHWVAQPQDGDPNVPYYKIALAMHYDLKDGLAPALRTLKEEKETRPHQFVQAILAVGRFGGKEQIADLEGLLTNQGMCYTLTMNRIEYVTQIRDVALATLVHMTEQNPVEYGFDRLQKSPQTVFAAHSAGFAKTNVKGREEALVKWQRWKAGQARPAK